MNRDRWLGIELRHFAALDAIARERSFRGAATRLGYVQSAISRQIAFLEQVTGMRLIERSQGPRPVHLTEAGQMLLEHADDILASIKAAKSDLGELAGGRTGEVRVGVFPGMPARVLPHALRALSKRRPDVCVTASEAATDAPFFEQLHDGCIDMAFVRIPLEPGPFAMRELVRVPWVLAVPAGSELANRTAPLTPGDIARLPLIALKADRLGDAIETRLSAEAGPLRVLFRSDAAETAMPMVAAGLGAAVVPRLAVEERDPRTAIVEVGELLPPLGIGLAWHRSRRLAPVVTEFRDLVIEVCSTVTRGDSRKVAHRGGDDDKRGVNNVTSSVETPNSLSGARHGV